MIHGDEINQIKSNQIKVSFLVVEVVVVVVVVVVANLWEGMSPGECTLGHNCKMA
jgi:hypothetical protein